MTSRDLSCRDSDNKHELWNIAQEWPSIFPYRDRLRSTIGGSHPPKSYHCDKRFHIDEFSDHNSTYSSKLNISELLYYIFSYH